MGYNCRAESREGKCRKKGGNSLFLFNVTVSFGHGSMGDSLERLVPENQWSGSLETLAGRGCIYRVNG